VHPPDPRPRAGTSFFIPAGLVISDRLQPRMRAAHRCSGNTCSGFSVIRGLHRHSPGFGIVSQILPVFARKPLLGPRVLIVCLIAIAFLSYTSGAITFPERDEPGLGNAVFRADARHHDSGDDHLPALDRHAVRRAPPLHAAALFALGLCRSS